MKKNKLTTFESIWIFFAIYLLLTLVIGFTFGYLEIYELILLIIPTTIIKIITYG
jgi:hypothetical protein